MLKLEVKKPRKFISPLLSKKSVTAAEIEEFEEATQNYLEVLERQRIEKQSEPNIVSNALKPYFENLSYVAQSYSQQGQSGMDLALMLEHSPSVIIEAKVFDSAAMITQNDINKKALHEAILYFMRERKKGNNRLYHIIITDFYRWFVFDAKDFDKLFWQDREIKKVFESVKDSSVLGDRTEDFYRMIAEQISGMKENLIDDKVIEAAYFDLRDARKPKETIALYKLLSKDTLLKAFNPNDANTLNKEFYNELLYILGLEEQKSGGKKLISRAKKPHGASLYENIARNLKLAGHTQEFEVIIRLMIVWINRILFLKLLESQLVKWNGDTKYRFLNRQTIDDFDRMKIFFFDILANRPHDRAHKEFGHIPYLNSSLFEMNEIEKKYIDISSLEDNCELPYYSKTVLKDTRGKRKEGSVNMLHYLFEFLDAYDFSSEGSEELVTESKSLINASVLGLIFEKLNGYKDGSFYTPSFITMYMSKETITKAIIEKFNQLKGWNCSSLNELDDKIEDKKEANAIIDSLSICDPAVGSGHFLVSSLNTILEIKSQLRILFDAEGKRIKDDYELSVENDELIVRDDEGEIFEYKRNSKKATRIQKMLFTEKQKIIENSLFGVDINPNSAQITRLRLWIELLKNSYYDESNQLVTMPNIDINIKVGNSLISRYGLHDEIDIPNIKHAIVRYKEVVKEYKEGNFVQSKEEIRSAIEELKGMFGLTLQAQWKQTERYKKLLESYVKEFGLNSLPRDILLDALDFNLDKLGGSQTSMFSEDQTLTKSKKVQKEKLLKQIEKASKEIDEIKKGKVYENAFEWRFEFPEVLDEEGNFVGFDVIIGNPPYIPLNKLKEIDYSQFGYRVFDKSGDILSLFFEKGITILNQYASMSLITSNSWLKTKYGEVLKDLFSASGASVQIINFEDTQIFEEATVETCIVTIDRSKPADTKTVNIRKFDAKRATVETLKEAITTFASSGEDNAKLMQKIEERGKQLKEWDISINYGIKTGFNKAFIIDTETRNRLIAEDPKSEALLKPMVRGRDVQKYAIEWADMWLVATLPSLNLDIEEYPAIKSYLSSFGKRLDQSGEKGSRKKTNNKWFETQDSIAYYEEFDKPKIVWGEISDAPKFAYDESGIYGNDKIFIMTGEHLKYLLSILNSKLSEWYFSKISVTTGQGTILWKKYKLEILPIAECKDQQPFIDLVDQIIEHKKQNQDTTDLEAKSNRMVYDLYGLAEEEVAVIEGKI
ncbi:DUF7149 domain-containing protein [Sulfurovum sp. NBC37-1]|uniref:type IIG restriction enzyme/methyltransferase n=1 Tax=Sulfurovum sp. (strain NBC37-1) TaxID=387093 RepID=UPI0001587C73|nr:TaqI-like C-terminal specificity domain-containing protein [Sulfurovum sp. NBC37-1]BAF72267.1 type II restriction-modification enzyme, R and M protein [Sulfurovum sp. NBC37-1]